MSFKNTPATDFSPNPEPIRNAIYTVQSLRQLAVYIEDLAGDVSDFWPDEVLPQHETNIDIRVVDKSRGKKEKTFEYKDPKRNNRLQRGDEWCRLPIIHVKLTCKWEDERYIYIFLQHGLKWGYSYFETVCPNEDAREGAEKIQGELRTYFNGGEKHRYAGRLKRYKSICALCLAAIWAALSFVAYYLLSWLPYPVLNSISQYMSDSTAKCAGIVAAAFGINYLLIYLLFPNVEIQPFPKWTKMFSRMRKITTAIVFGTFGMASLVGLGVNLTSDYISNNNGNHIETSAGKHDSATATTITTTTDLTSTTTGISSTTMTLPPAVQSFYEPP